MAQSWAVVTHACNPSTWEAEALRFLSSRPAWSTEWVQGQPGLHRETLSRKKTKQNKTKKEYGPENGMTRTQVGSQRWRSSEWVWLRSSVFMIWLCSSGFLWDFYQWERELSLTFSLDFGTFFFIGLPYSYKNMCLVLLQLFYARFCCFPWKAFSFLKKKHNIS